MRPQMKETITNNCSTESNQFFCCQQRVSSESQWKFCQVGDAEAPDFENVFVVSSELCCNSNEISVTNFSESFVKESFFLQLKFCWWKFLLSAASEMCVALRSESQWSDFMGGANILCWCPCPMISCKETHKLQIQAQM